MKTSSDQSLGKGVVANSLAVNLPAVSIPIASPVTAELLTLVDSCMTGHEGGP